MGMQNQDVNLVLSTDAKPRLKWTPQLHQRFIEAVTQLGGADKATPKTLMRMMGIPGLTLYHLKSHLQKFRLGKSQNSETCSESKEEEYRNNPSIDVYLQKETIDGTAQNQIHENRKAAQALQMQMEVQRKLYEQIEVQRHLQLRIEAQGKYLQSVLKRAQETLAGHNSYSEGLEIAKAELSELVSMVTSGCSSPLSELTEVESSSSQRKRVTDGSLLENYEINEDRIQPRNCPLSMNGGRKRIISDGNCLEHPPGHGKRSTIYSEKDGDKLKKLRFLSFDLNKQYHHISSPNSLDLNCKEIEQIL